MKRFYTLVSTEKTDAGHRVLLDGKPIKTPAKSDFTCPNAALADLVQAEWAAQTDTIKPDEMPITQILSTAIDRVTPQRDVIQDDMIGYFESDLLYFRAAEPAALKDWQSEKWDPWLDYARQELGNVPPIVYGFTIPPLETETHAKLSSEVEQLDTVPFTIMMHLTAVSGSVLLAYALIKNAISVDAFTQAALCEELFYIDHYKTEHNGLDPQLEAKQKAMRRDLEASIMILKTMN